MIAFVMIPPSSPLFREQEDDHATRPNLFVVENREERGCYL